MSARSTCLFRDFVLPISSPEIDARVAGRPERERLEGLALFHVDFYKDDPHAPKWPQWVATEGHKRTAPERGIRFARIAQAIETVVDGAGYAMCGIALARERLEAGELSLPFPLATGRWTSHTFQLRIRTDALLRPQVRRFRQWLLEEAQGHRGVAGGESRQPLARNRQFSGDCAAREASPGSMFSVTTMSAFSSPRKVSTHGPQGGGSVHLTSGSKLRCSSAGCTSRPLHGWLRPESPGPRSPVAWVHIPTRLARSCRAWTLAPGNGGAFRDPCQELLSDRRRPGARSEFNSRYVLLASPNRSRRIARANFWRRAPTSNSFGRKYGQSGSLARMREPTKNSACWNPVFNVAMRLATSASKGRCSFT